MRLVFVCAAYTQRDRLVPFEFADYQEELEGSGT
jgi:hypothetical protein